MKIHMDKKKIYDKYYINMVNMINFNLVRNKKWWFRQALDQKNLDFGIEINKCLKCLGVKKF